MNPIENIDPHQHEGTPGKLDDLDIKIVAFLQENARMPFTQIAEKLGVTERTIRVRVAQLQNEGILSLVGVVNPIKVGLNIQTIVHVSVETNMLDHVVNQLQHIDEVRYVVLTSGEYQLFLEVFTKNHDEFSDFLMNKLNKIEGVVKTNVILELKVLKSRFNFIR